MSKTGKQSPLGVNLAGGLLYNSGLNINPTVVSYMGSSKTNVSYTFGKTVSNTCLLKLTWAINDAYNRGSIGGGQAGGPTYTNSTYDNLLSIGQTSIPSLGNSVSPDYQLIDPTNVWAADNDINGSASYYTGSTGPANTGYAISGIGGINGNGQTAKWRPWSTSNPNHSVTQWGYFRLHALQAWNEFNYNAGGASNNASSVFVTKTHPDYKEFLASFMSCVGYLETMNPGIFATQDSKSFLQYTYSNQNDLITGDIAGVSLSFKSFGEDLMALGRAFDLNYIDSFGLPSNLLKTLYKNNAITNELAITLAASGLPPDQITNLASNDSQVINAEVEKKIYGAFLLINGVSLQDILNTLNCYSTNLTSLADLLNVKTMFPLSYTTLTVPLYNSEPGPTNSKTYYLIYTGENINPLINSPSVREKVGTIIPAGLIFTTNTTTQTSYNDVDIQTPPTGFNSYLVNILPESIGLAAGAFSYSMQQIRNINKVNNQRFSQIVYSLETSQGLPLTTAPNQPTIPAQTTAALYKTNIGSGPYGTYTMSDFFGSMSGLPYPHVNMFTNIAELETQKLYNIYDQLYLATQWKCAELTITQTARGITRQSYVPAVAGTKTTPPVPAIPNITDWYYKVSITVNNIGGGYGRGNAPAPTFTISPNNVGASVVAKLGPNTDLGSVGGGLHGRLVFSINNGSEYKYATTVLYTNSPPQPTMPIEYITIPGPPIAGLPVQANGSIATNGTNSVGYIVPTPGVVYNYWPSMNSVCQGYINQANEEILAIQNRNQAISRVNNLMYNTYGRMLQTEQRLRFIALQNVPIISDGVKDVYLNHYPNTIYNFIDNLPTYAQKTLPHMHVQTLEAISNETTVGGQSLIGIMRQERNQARLQEVGIDLDNNLGDNLKGVSYSDYITLALNGTAPIAANSGIVVPECKANYTYPSWVEPRSNLGNVGNPLIFDSEQQCCLIGLGGFISGTYDTYVFDDCNNKTVITNKIQGPFVNPNVLIRNNTFTSNIAPTGNLAVELPPTGNLTIDITTGNSIYVTPNNFSQVANIIANVQPNITANFTLGNVNNINLLDGNIGTRANLIRGIGTFIVAVGGDNLGNTVQILPTEIDLTFVNTILNSAPDIDAAIATVIECNCDCWI